MKLSDIVGHAGLAGYAVVALVCFLVAFGSIAIRVFQPSRREEFDRARSLPLGGDAEREQP